VSEIKTVRIVVDMNFFIFVNEKNKLAEIQFNNFLNDDVKSNFIGNFVELSAMLRHFLNRNDVDFSTMLYFENKKEKTTTQHRLELKSIKEKKSGERFLFFNFVEKFVTYGNYDEQELYDYEVNFAKFDIRITPQIAQLWLEYLNKFAVTVQVEE